MTFRFNWQDPAEMTALKILAEGEAQFKINHIYETDDTGQPLRSKKSGEDMIKVELSVTDSKGANGLIYDYILASHAWKLHNLCKSVNREELYSDSKDGLNVQKLIAEKGRCMIKTDEPSNPNFEARSVIAKYLVANQSKRTLPEPEVEIIDDDLPF